MVLRTRLDCSSWSVSSSTDCVCFCLISWSWDSWLRFSSSMAFFSRFTSCSRLALEGWSMQISCCVAVVSSVSSSSDFRASSSSPRSRLIFSALFLAARSESRSSCRSEMCPSSSLIFFRALFF
ncbi:hypothetical protein EYF80_031821 [Liparis tanakae]|uniref:Uncharacterized protein n=1 Tax=Liparis tanakae TaxID=230148 RepID=A0A4Z2GWG7_9TELE|nr:hypothetical protein EYF80_031821 [Liparis tanakae]